MPDIPKRPTCGNCHHGTHPGRKCVTKTVAGPPSSQGMANYDTGGYDHIGRDVTECLCTESVPEQNGHQLPTPESAPSA